ncbi:MAG: TolB family protein [Gemmatimonadota bacterium]
MQPIALVLCLTALIANEAAAQFLTRPARDWQTVETATFRVHFPAEMRTWAMPVAQRLESYASAVSQATGSRPRSRTTVLIEDPSNVANGFAVPILEGPVIFLWPTPPTPGPTFGSHRGWGEILALHEFGHIAQLTIESRNPWERRLWSILPSRIGPVARKSPAWVIEGYATYLEGVLTGNGRPHSVGRAAVLRQWALEGRLPSYASLGATEPFLGGAMRYLVGSAFLEWLAERKGEASLRNLWRRMSARERRSFDEAFRGVYGAAPDELYGAFFTEMMEQALAARRELTRAGLVEGDLVQRMSWSTGGPAVSKDGSMVAVVLRSPRRPSRVVVWRSADEPLDSRVLDARRRALARDPLDVAPFDSFPPPKRPEATLGPSGGRGFDAPRWFADNERLLVSHDEPLGDGATRPDLWIWNRRSGDRRRLTHGGAIRQGDPAPDGQSAAAVRCAAGICDLVRVSIPDGTISNISPGSPFVVWHRPRFSADGRRIAAAVQREGRWGIAIVDATTGEVRHLQTGDEADRHSPSWTNDGKLVVVSERGGVANLELLDPDSRGVTALTRVTGAVAEPDAGGDGRVWFLGLHTRGMDVRRIGIRDAVQSGADRIVALNRGLAPVAPVGIVAGPSYREQPVDGPRGYGLGPRAWRVLPGLNYGPDGDMLSLMIANIDPVGRFSTVFQGGTGQKGGWRGGSFAGRLQTSPLIFEGSAWVTNHKPSEQRSGTFASSDIDAEYNGIALSAGWEHRGGTVGLRARAGGTVGRVDGTQLDAASRVAAFTEGSLHLSISAGSTTIVPGIAAQVAQGETGGDAWSRSVVTASLSLGRAARLLGMRGRTDTPDAGEFGREFEQFSAGGGYLPFVDEAILSQRVSIPSVPVGFVAGSRIELYRAELNVAGMTPYAVWVAAGDSIGQFKRVIGVEKAFSHDAIGFARLPSTRIRLGVGYSFDPPYDEKLRPYLSVTWRP